MTVSRAKKEWGGYKRQPERATIYIGLAFYLPKVERKDLTIYSAKNLTLTNRVEVDRGAEYVSRILGGSYTDVFFQQVKNRSREAELGMASRYGFTYSENNMGFGEGRVVHTIRLLESCPEKSLIILEEPETSLHEYAQYEFTKYLMNLSSRRGHQIIFSTHSTVMIDALPFSARKMLSRSQSGVQVEDNLSSNRVRVALSDGHSGHLIVCVEDEFAKSLLREFVRRWAPQLLPQVRIIPFGDAKAVFNANRYLLHAEVRSIAIRDADQGEAPADGVFKLPGTLPPEKDIFLDPASVSVLLSNYGFDLNQYLIANPETDHHRLSTIAADQAGFSRDVIETDCIRAVLDSRGEDWGRTLIDVIGESV